MRGRLSRQRLVEPGVKNPEHQPGFLSYLLIFLLIYSSHLIYLLIFMMALQRTESLLSLKDPSEDLMTVITFILGKCISGYTYAKVCNQFQWLGAPTVAHLWIAG
jgi:hypothetical protein